MAVAFEGGQLNFAAEEADDIGKRADGQDFEPLHDGRFGGIEFGKNEAANAILLRAERERQRAVDWANSAIEAELADECIIAEFICSKRTRCRKHANRQWQIEQRAILAYIGRGEVCGDSAC